ncbi:hexokinase A [Tulasnella sp. 427]|nr:hexokinase A [Tulasnella sp. 427]
MQEYLDTSILQEAVPLPCALAVPKSAAMDESLSNFGGGPPNSQHFKLYSRWADGGWGMLITGNVQVDPNHLTLGRDVTIPAVLSPERSPPRHDQHHLHQHHLSTCYQFGVDAAAKDAGSATISDDLIQRYEKQFTLTPEKMPNEFRIRLWLANGEEKGDYLALELGGTNLRVCLVTLTGGGKFEIKQKKYRLTEEQKQMEGSLLFDFCADSLSAFLQSARAEGIIKEGAELPIGSPYVPSLRPPHPQTNRIDHGILIRWIKGFGNPNVEVFDVTQLFADSLKRHNVPVTLTALVNDTTGALIASHYTDPRTRIGVILGTGCNAAYAEKVGNIPKMKHLGIPDETLISINCEWGAFDSVEHKHLPRTKDDEIIDLKSNKLHEQVFEKCISGRYLGEIFRLVIKELIDEGTLFQTQDTSKLNDEYCFDTALLSTMESDTTPDLSLTSTMFSQPYALQTTLPESTFFKSLGKLVGTCAARLASCGMAAKKLDCLEEGRSIGDGGSLYDMYPGFKERIHEGLTNIFGEKGK